MEIETVESCDPIFLPEHCNNLILGKNIIAKLEMDKTVSSYIAVHDYRLSAKLEKIEQKIKFVDRALTIKGPEIS